MVGLVDVEEGNGVAMLESRKKERGANLVEFALVAPFLILLLFGIIEFSWLFAQDLTIKHGAREGARLAAVAFGGNTATLCSETVNRMNIATAPEVDITLNQGLVAPNTSMEPGDGIVVTVSQTRTSLTGIMDWAFPASFTDLSSTVEIRAEQTPAGYWSTTPYSCP
ncbi:MAG: TadE/TadG family type IV pilus assembly protein [Acidimicrobiia bacterium]